jgi:hypothetical protein
MAAPYERGQQVAYIETDPDGLRVHRATVTNIQALEWGRWAVQTDWGFSAVDAQGIGAELVPLDPEIEAEMFVLGDGYLVTAARVDLERSLDVDRGRDRTSGQDRGFDRGEGDHGYGW